MDLRDIFRFYAEDFVWMRNSTADSIAKNEKEIIRRAIGDIATAIALDAKDMDLLNGIEKRIEGTKRRIEEMKKRLERDEKARIEGLRAKLQEKLKKAGFAEVFLKVEETEKERTEHRRVQGRKANYIVNIRYVCEDGKWHVDRINVEPIS